MEENIEEINAVPTDEDRFWRTLFTVSIAFGILYFISILIVSLAGGRYTPTGGRLSAETLIGIKLVFYHVFMLIQKPIIGILAALVLYVSMRFAIRKAIVVCAIYFVVSIALPALSSISAYSLFRQSPELIAWSKILIYFFCEFIILVTYGLALLFLPRIFHKLKNEIVLLSVCTVIFVVYSAITGYFTQYLISGSGVLLKTYLQTVVISLLKQLLLMGITYAAICIILYLKKHNKAAEA